MKYIELPELSMLSRMLTHNSNECTVHARLEAYSCKAITKDKRMHRHLEQNYVGELASSPPYLTEREPEVTAFGAMDSYSSRKTLYLLIGTLNHAFPDHDFSDLRPENFSREQSGVSILNALSTTLVSLNTPNATAGASTARSYSAYPPASPNFFPSSSPTSSSPVNRLGASLAAPQIVTGTHPTLYRLLDDIIKLEECQVYTYTPDMMSDPHATDSDDEEDDAWDSDESESSEDDVNEDGGVFEFNYGDDEPTARPQPQSFGSSSSSSSSRVSRPRDTLPIKSSRRDDSSPDSLSTSPTRSRPRSYIRKRQGGALLWSSHSFLHNKKLKRILYITTWSRKKVGERMMTASQQLERFNVWDGGVGAGARAFGLTQSLGRRGSLPLF
jgi:hypothetical protein